MIVEILVEEPSMKFFFLNFLPRILPDELKNEVKYFIREHRGKNDLIKSIPRKVSELKHKKDNEKPYLIILIDQDSNDCQKLKEEIMEQCKNYEKLLIRIVCRELESWYLGDLNAIEKPYLKIFKSKNYIYKSNLRNTDKLSAKDYLKKHILKSYKPIETARQISKFMDIKNNKSPSFKKFISGFERVFSITE